MRITRGRYWLRKARAQHLRLTFPQARVWFDQREMYDQTTAKRYVVTP